MMMEEGLEKEYTNMYKKMMIMMMEKVTESGRGGK
jgi:hypothetical protein